jgi:hypothetical protein
MVTKVAWSMPQQRVGGGLRRDGGTIFRTATTTTRNDATPQERSNCVPTMKCEGGFCFWCKWWWCGHRQHEFDRRRRIERSRRGVEDGGKIDVFGRNHGGGGGWQQVAAPAAVGRPPPPPPSSASNRRRCCLLNTRERSTAWPGIRSDPACSSRRVRMP